MGSIAIVGAGIIGLSSAWRLAQRGWKVKIFDRREALHEASWAAVGMLAPGGEIDNDARLAEMALRSLALYPEFVRDLEEDSGIPIEFRQCGAIEIGATEEKAVRQRALGIPSEPCTYRGQAARRYPNDAVVDPLSINEALLAVCGTREIEIHENEAVTEILPAGVKTARRSYDADRILIAAGAWSSSLLPGLPRAWPVRGHLISYEMPPGLLSCIIRGEHTYVIQRESGAIIAGSSMEDAGFDRTIDDAIVEDIHRRASKLVPELADVKPSNTWTGLRPATDAGPVIGRIGDTNVWTAYGHFRNGILLAPYTADVVGRSFGSAVGSGF